MIREVTTGVYSIDGETYRTQVQFGTGAFISDIEEIAQLIKQNLLTLQGECFTDIELGVNWFALMSVPNSEQLITTSIRETILSTTGVRDIISIDTSVGGSSLSFSATVSTELGELDISQSII